MNKIAVLVLDCKDYMLPTLQELEQEFEFIQSNNLNDDMLYNIPNQKTIEYFQTIINKHNIQYILANSEKNVRLAAYLRTHFNLYGYKIPEITKVTNKYEMRKEFSQFINCPKFYSYAEFVAQEANIPDGKFILKPYLGFSCKNVYKLQNKEQVLAFIENNKENYIIEDYLEIETEYHCDGIVQKNNLNKLFVSEYSLPILKSENANVYSITLPKNNIVYQQLKQVISDLLQNIPLDNFVFHIEIYKIQNKFYLGEIGLRPGGAGIPTAIQELYQTNIWQFFIYSQLNKECEVKYTEEYQELYGVRIGYLNEEKNITLEQIKSIVPSVLALKKRTLVKRNSIKPQHNYDFTDLIIFTTQEYKDIKDCILSLDNLYLQEK